MQTETTLDLDARRRVSLGGLFEADVTHLIARRYDDGSVVLEPARVISLLEQRFHEDPVEVEVARAAARSTDATALDLTARRVARRPVG
jgi:hypothetical protein